MSHLFVWGKFWSKVSCDNRKDLKMSSLVRISNIQLVTCYIVVRVQRQCCIKLLWLLVVCRVDVHTAAVSAEIKPTHVHYFANPVKVVQHSVMLADREAAFSLFWGLKKGRRFNQLCHQAVFAKQCYPRAGHKFQSQKKNAVPKCRVSGEMGGVKSIGTTEWNSLKIWPKNERKVLMSRVRAKNHADRNNTALLRLFQVVSAGIRHQLPIKIPCYCVAEAFCDRWNPCVSTVCHYDSASVNTDRWLWGLIAGLFLWFLSIVIQLKRSVTLRFSILGSSLMTVFPDWSQLLHMNTLLSLCSLTNLMSAVLTSVSTTAFGTSELKILNTDSSGSSP